MKTNDVHTPHLFSCNEMAIASNLSQQKTKIMEQIKCEMKPVGLSMEVDRQEFALALKTWRLRQGLTQRQLAQRWGTNRYAIMHAESAKDITWENAYRLFAKLSDELRKEAANG